MAWALFKGCSRKKGIKGKWPLIMKLAPLYSNNEKPLLTEFDIYHKLDSYEKCHALKKCFERRLVTSKSI